MKLTGLPVATALPELRRALASAAAAVLEAPPGAGKSTLVPLALLDEPWLRGRKILMLEPRRLAARAVACRMADLLGEPAGRTVGYRTRLDTRVSSATRIEVLTEGILTRRLQSDPELADTGLVIFDEFHERHLQSDLTLAFTLDAVASLSLDLKVLVMSATLDGERLAAFLGSAPLVRAEGRMFPVEIRHLPDVDPRALCDRVADTIHLAFEETEGDLLVFLPGGREIRRVAERLPENPNTVVLPLFGDLPRAAQDQALRPDASGRRKIILATPIAETSLTIEGVRVVVDSGWCRRPRFDPRTAMTGLETVRIAQSSAAQRAGRAGRTAPGVAYRLWSESTHRGLQPHAQTEILATDPASLALELAHWGASDAAQLRWLDPPPAVPLAQARELLSQLDALDANGRITRLGRRLATLPLHPRLGHMILRAESLGLAPLACDIAALLEERDLVRGAASRDSCDLAERLELLQAFRRGQRGRIDRHTAEIVDRSAKQIRSLVKQSAPPRDVDDETVGLLLAFAYPDRIGQLREAHSGRYLLSSGRGARLPREAARLARHELIVVASLDAGQEETEIFLAAPVAEDDLRRHLPHLFTHDANVVWNGREQCVTAAECERLGQITLAEKPLQNPDSSLLRRAMCQGIRLLGIGALPWTPELRLWQARVLSLRHWLPEENWPNVSDEWLAAHLEEWLEPFLDGCTRRSHLAKLDLGMMLAQLLDRRDQRRLDEGAPTHLGVPGGSRIRLQYVPGESPVLAVKLQEMFGLGDTPRVAWGRVPVTLHLLSPAGRPIQITQDLRNFWNSTYSEVKKELRGRYPKHPWPDDPWNAPPTRRAKRRN